MSVRNSQMLVINVLYHQNPNSNISYPLIHWEHDSRIWSSGFVNYEETPL